MGLAGPEVGVGRIGGSWQVCEGVGGSRNRRVVVGKGIRKAQPQGWGQQLSFPSSAPQVN